MVKLDDGPGIESGPELHLHHTKQSIVESRHSCVLCAMIWQLIWQNPDDQADIRVGEDGVAVPLINPESRTSREAFSIMFLYIEPNNISRCRRRLLLNSLEAIGVYNVAYCSSRVNDDYIYGHSHYWTTTTKPPLMNREYCQVSLALPSRDLN